MNKKRRGTRSFLAVAIGLVLVVVGIVVSVRWYGDWSLRQRYPVKYKEEVYAACALYPMDPALILAVMHTESTLRPGAVSSVGALGLMQVMPETGEWIATKIGPAEFDADMLKEPDINVLYGTWLLRFLAQRYDGEAVSVLAAYHQGWGRVDGWREEAGGSLELEQVPSDLSRQYVKKVLVAYENYRKLYEFEPVA